MLKLIITVVTVLGFAGAAFAQAPAPVEKKEAVKPVAVAPAKVKKEKAAKVKKEKAAKVKKTAAPAPTK